MSNSTYIEMEDDVREDIGECMPSAPKKEKRRVEDVKPTQWHNTTPAHESSDYAKRDCFAISDFTI